jgi:hypothetical protein
MFCFALQELGDFLEHDHVEELPSVNTRSEELNPTYDTSMSHSKVSHSTCFQNPAEVNGTERRRRCTCSNAHGAESLQVQQPLERDGCGIHCMPLTKLLALQHEDITLSRKLCSACGTAEEAVPADIALGCILTYLVAQWRARRHTEGGQDYCSGTQVK